VGVYIGKINVDLSSNDKAFKFVDQILNKVRSDKPSLNINTVRRRFRHQTKGKNYIVVDTNTFYSIPSEVLHTLSDEIVGFFVLNCVQAELHHKCVAERRCMLCLVESTKTEGNNISKNSGNKSGYLKGKEKLMKENKCDTEIALYFMNLPKYMADSAVFLTLTAI
ncbi:MAG: hypothetical protein JZD40_00120, partial [Sulfolobus sp.]|nr:hypothetical protein [Sulfolobus sp.]